MKYQLTVHARTRMKERVISEHLVQQTLDMPTKISADSQGNKLYKKLYFLKGKQRLLLLAGKLSGKKFKIFTVIETSKISKYL